MTVAVDGAPAVARPAIAVAPASAQRARSARRLRWWREAGALGIGVIVLIWTLVPVYNIFMVSLESKGDVFTETIFPARPSLESFWVVITQGHWYLEEFWHQFANSVYIGVGTVFFVSGGGPALSTHVLATLGIRDAFEVARPELGVAAVLTALPLMIPLVLILMRKLRTTEVTL